MLSQPDMPRLSPPPSSFGGFCPRSHDLGLFFSISVTISTSRDGAPPSRPAGHCLPHLAAPVCSCSALYSCCICFLLERWFVTNISDNRTVFIWMGTL